MPGAVRHVGDEVHIGPFRTAQQTVYRIDNHLDNVNVLPLVEAANIVRLPYLSLVENKVDGTRMVFHIQPVAHVLSLAVYRQRFPMADVVDKQRNKLFRELIRSVVVGAVGDHGGHAVGVVERPHKMVAGGLGGTVRRVRLILEVLREELLPVGQVVLTAGCLGGERRLNPLRMRHLQRPVHLVGANVVESARNPAVGRFCLPLVNIGGRKLVFRKALRKIISFRLFVRSFWHLPP